MKDRIDSNNDKDMGSSNSSAAAKKNIQLFLKFIPLLVGFVYITGYLISLIFLRILKIQSVDLIKASCFETGITFYLLSFTIVGIFAIFPLIYFLYKGKAKIVSAFYAKNIAGVFLSILSFLMLLFSIVYITLFVKPGSFSKISYYFMFMLFIGFFGFVTLVSIIVLSENIIKKFHIIKEEHLRTSVDIVRIILFITIVGLVIKIFWGQVDSIIPVIKDEKIIYYILLLLMLAILTARIFWHLLHPSNFGKYALFILTPLWGIFFYVTLIAYVFGPYIYIPTSRGGGWYYQTISIIPDESFLRQNVKIFSDSDKRIPLFLLAEAGSSIYITKYKRIFDQRSLFQYLRKSDVYRIRLKNIKSILYYKDQHS